MSTFSTPQQPTRPDDNTQRDQQSTTEVSELASPENTSPEETSQVAAVEAPVGTGGSVSAPMPGAGAFSFVIIGGRLRDFWRLITLNPKVMFGLAIVVFFALVAIIGPFLLHTDPNALSSAALSPPSAAHWLGTTQTGQDVFAQLVYGSRTTIFWGFLTGLGVTLLSIIVGLSAGYFGGVVDELLSLLTNIFLVLPAFPLAIVLAAFVPYKGPLTVALVVLITSWAWGARVLRAQTLSLRKRDFIEAAKTSGETTFRIIFYELLPNEIAIVAANFIGTVIYVILAEVGLEFLGLGDPTVVSWGSMFYWAQNNDALLLGAWWWFIPPGICIALLGAALTFINFGMDEIANPRLRRERKPKTAAHTGEGDRIQEVVAS
jgi:peptide/nickel transport system permease protein